jgi:hypothetical protein
MQLILSMCPNFYKLFFRSFFDYYLAMDPTTLQATSQTTPPVEYITPPPTDEHIIYGASLDNLCSAGLQDVAEGRGLLAEVSRNSGTDAIMSDETAAKKRALPEETDDAHCDPFAADNWFGSQAE